MTPRKLRPSISLAEEVAREECDAYWRRSKTRRKNRVELLWKSSALGRVVLLAFAPRGGDPITVYGMTDRSGRG